MRLKVLLITVCLTTSAAAQQGADSSDLIVEANGLFGVLPPDAATEQRPITDARVDLGRKLYFDARLSKNHDISCNSCHRLDRFGVDNEPTSPGHKGQRGGRNSPTVYNAAIHIAQFWDGREPDVEAQAKGPVTNPVEMALADSAAADTVLRSIPGYAPLFAAAFPGEDNPVSFDNMAIAIGAFERRLMTPSRFDDFLSGDEAALSAAEESGLKRFVDSGCAACHLGPLLGGSIYQKLGLVHEYETEDTGRMQVTGKESDRKFFKVPSLRNITKTGPYFHDGSVNTLEDAVKKMAWHQLGKELSDIEVAEIVTFLGSLEGTIDAGIIAMPDLPASGPDTPPADPS